MPKYADVIVPLSLNDFYTYSIPDDMQLDCVVGKRVLVQFGKKKFYTAIVRKIHDIKPEYETKDIFSVLDEKPILNEIHLKFWEWISEYYMAAIGEIYAAALPISLRIETQTQIFLAKSIIDDELNENETIIVNNLKNQKTLSISSITKLLNVKNPIKIINKLIEKGIIDVYEHFKSEFKPKYQKNIKLADTIKTEIDLQKAFEKVSRASKQTDILLAYCSLSGLRFDEIREIFVYKEVTKKELLQKATAESHIINALYKKNILVEYEKRVSRLEKIDDNAISFNKLSEDQKSAFDNIKNSFNQFDVTLLYGVTSSGKTEIYIHLIREYINKGKQVLYLLPEIALTSQIIVRLRVAFGSIVGIYHSKFNDAERAEIWNKINPNSDDINKYQIVLGVRSAMFLPFDNLGLIIIDEEHETTFKQFDPSPRYNARDGAIILAKYFNAKVLLGTATPSIDTFYNVLNKKFGLVELKVRHKNIELPEIIVADIRTARNENKMKSLFHPILLEYMNKALNSKEQIILFQNRRGFAPYIECKTCGWIPVCRNCDVSLTYHTDTNSLVCHYCGYKTVVVSKCEHCGSLELETKGFGTQKVEDEIKIFFPSAQIARLDLDVSKRKHGYEEVISAFSSGEVDILVGTQMVTKGLDFKNVSVVGILNADNLLNFPDFRSYERAFQLMTQVSGRAGRMHRQGSVIIQTYQPNHKVIKYILDNDFNSLFSNELTERQTYNYPPFCKLLKITLKHKKVNIVNDISEYFGAMLRKYFKDRVLGPQAPIISRIQNYHIKEILVKIEPEMSLQKAKRTIISIADLLKQKNNFSNVIISFNVDPV